MRKWWFGAAVGVPTMIRSYPYLIPGLRDWLPRGSEALWWTWFVMGLASLAVLVYSFRATRVGKDTALATIIRLVQDAQGSKVPIQRVVDRVSAYLTPAVMILAIAGFVVWYVFGPAPALTYALIVAVTTLIIACPCALGMATPMSLTRGVGLEAQHGIRIRSGDALQTAAKLNAVVVDKTGTITEGKPALTDIVLERTARSCPRARPCRSSSCRTLPVSMSSSARWACCAAS
jgi:P-type E1-E2 ATPase